MKTLTLTLLKQGEGEAVDEVQRLAAMAGHPGRDVSPGVILDEELDP